MSEAIHATSTRTGSLNSPLIYPSVGIASLQHDHKGPEVSENEFVVERETKIAAKPEVIRSLIADFRQWPTWSPWEELDPDMRHDYGGADHGVGSWTSWSGNRKAGAGRMEITAMTDDSVTIALAFLKPFKSQSTTVFGLASDGESTTVTWTMRGPKTLLTKLMGIFWPMDKVVGKDFEKGLSKLKTAAEPKAI